ncbi:hypothetical protein KCU85_g419, partial [Aureobasidium melanogenum]
LPVILLRRCIEDERNAVITSGNNSSTTATLNKAHNTTALTATSVASPLSTQTAISSGSTTSDVPSSHNAIVAARCEHPVVSTLSCIDEFDLDDCLLLMCVLDVSANGKVVCDVEKGDTAVHTTGSQKSQRWLDEADQPRGSDPRHLLQRQEHRQSDQQRPDQKGLQDQQPRHHRTRPRRTSLSPRKQCTRACRRVSMHQRYTKQCEDTAVIGAESEGVGLDVGFLAVAFDGLRVALSQR